MGNLQKFVWCRCQNGASEPTSNFLQNSYFFEFYRNPRLFFLGGWFEMIETSKGQGLGSIYQFWVEVYDCRGPLSISIKFTIVRFIRFTVPCVQQVHEPQCTVIVDFINLDIEITRKYNHAVIGGNKLKKFSKLNKQYFCYGETRRAIGNG